MNKKERIETFIALEKIAVAGVSTSGKKFSNSAFKSLTNKGYQLYAMNPKGGEVNGVPLYRSFKEIPEKMDGALIIVNANQSAQVVQEAYEAGITNIWFQLDTDSKEAIDFCEEKNLNYIHKECILMFAKPVKGVHRFHKFIKKLSGKLPA